MRNKFYDFLLNQRNRNFYFFDFFKIFHSFFQIHFNFINSFCEKIPSVNVILRNFRTFWRCCSYLNRLSFTETAYVIFKLINLSVKFILFNFIIFQNVYIVLILINLTLQFILEFRKLINPLFQVSISIFGIFFGRCNSFEYAIKPFIKLFSKFSSDIIQEINNSSTIVSP